MSAEPVAGDLVAGVLTPEQQGVVAYFRGLNVPAQWFVGVPDDEGKVEVIALGESFVWSFLVEADGQESHTEAELGEFSTGISC